MALALSLTFAEQESILTNCTQIPPSTLCSWNTGSTEETNGKFPQGAALGLHDGTFLLFKTANRARVPSSSRSASTSQDLIHLRPLSPKRFAGPRTPRSGSPASGKSINFSPFQVSKSRVISSVSAEQAEAPTNYVDFEDEQQKLKDMVKRKGVKDKTMADTLLHGVDKDLTVEKSGDAAISLSQGSFNLHKKEDYVPFSPASSTKSLSAPPSPSLLPILKDPKLPEGDWSFICQVIPPKDVAFGPVSALKTLERAKLIVSLSQSGSIGIYSMADGACLAITNVLTDTAPPPPGFKSHSKLPAIWHWKTLHIESLAKSYLVLACATQEPTSSAIQSHETGDDQGEQTRLVLFEFHLSQPDPDSVSFKKISDWTFDGPTHGVHLRNPSNGQITLLYIDPSGHLIQQRLTVSDDPSTLESVLADSGSSVHLPNPFKALSAARSAESLVTSEKGELSGRILVDEVVDIGGIALADPVLGIQTYDTKNGVRGVVWSEKELSGFELGDVSLRNLFSISMSGIHEVTWVDSSNFRVLFRDRAERYNLVHVDANNDPASPGSPSSILRPTLVNKTPLPRCNCITMTTSGVLLVTQDQHQRRKIKYVSCEEPALASDTNPRVLWKGPRKNKEFEKHPNLTAMLPIDLELIILGYSDGILCRSSFSKSIRGQTRLAADVISNIPLSASIMHLHLILDGISGTQLIVGGADDGSVAIWSLDTLALLARWTIFTEPLSEVISINEGHLKGCIFCISQDGTIAVVAIDGFQLLYLVPSSAAPLTKICLGGENLMLLYLDGRARLWNVKTLEFWRSMNVEKAVDMLKQGEWTEWPIGTLKPSSKFISVLPSRQAAREAPTILFDLEAFLLEVGASMLPPGAKSVEVELNSRVAAKRENTYAALSALLTFGLNEDIDRLCCDKLGIQKSKVVVGTVSHGSAAVLAGKGSLRPWTVSPDVSAIWATAVISLLQAVQQYEGIGDDAHTISAFYIASLAQVVGTSYQAPNLAILTRQCLESKAPEIRSASRLRFEAGVARLLDDEITSLVETWQNSLPCMQLESLRESTQSAMALFICGSVALDKYSLLPTGALTNIAKSIALYLHNEASQHRSLAIDLCSRGFPVWQQYVDAVEMLRALFTLATTTRKEAISVHNVGQQARNAVLQIASSNTPLFMTTLSIDILQPKSVQHRKAVLQLVVFIIRKKPLVLYGNLPRLVEAVVKSLDPSSNASREAVIDSATEILGHVVESYPTVDFHGPTQRLVVGTSEGAVVMYDLKTATRLYVLEGHKKRTTACSFSPDGRRLVTLSLEEHTVLVWKVGSSFTSFFMPGAPPRQGHAGSDPYKVYDFALGDEGNMTVAATFDFVKFEWPSDRSVRVRIKELTLTFAT